MADTEIDEGSVVYFGCWDRTGHGFYDQHGRSLHPGRDECGPWGYAVDSIRGRGGNGSHVPQGDRYLAHADGWTVLDVTDRTVDSRGNSHSAFLAPAVLTEQQMIVLAWGQYPRIAERIGLPKPPAPAAVVSTLRERCVAAMTAAVWPDGKWSAEAETMLDTLLPILSDAIKPHRWDMDYPDSAPPECHTSHADSFYSGVLHSARVVRELLPPVLVTPSQADRQPRDSASETKGGQGPAGSGA